MTDGDDWIKEQSYEAQGAFLTELANATLHGQLPTATQNKLCRAAFGMHGRCMSGRIAVEASLKVFEEWSLVAKGNEKGALVACIDELKIIQRALG